MTRRVTVVFRYDDYSSRSDTDLEVQLLQTFENAGLPCTFGVVPCVTPVDEELLPQTGQPLTKAKASILRQAIRSGTLQVALHGYTHQTILARENGGWSEFKGLPYEAQAERIGAGRAMLEEMVAVPIRTFIPPWNSYDTNTLRGLERLGFSCISAGKYGVTSPLSQLSFLPSTCGLADFPAALSATKSHPGKSVIVVLLHPIDFQQNRESAIAGIGHLLETLRSQTDTVVRTIEEATERAQGLRALEYERYFRPLHRRLLPSFLHKQLLFYPLPNH